MKRFWKRSGDIRCLVNPAALLPAFWVRSCPLAQPKTFQCDTVNSKFVKSRMVKIWRQQHARAQDPENEQPDCRLPRPADKTSHRSITSTNWDTTIGHENARSCEACTIDVRFMLGIQSYRPKIALKKRISNRFRQMPGPHSSSDRRNREAKSQTSESLMMFSLRSNVDFLTVD